jgi:hypothetical protein
MFALGLGRQSRAACICALVLTTVLAAAPVPGPPHVYLVLWFDTEDFILPASDDAALRLATFLSHEHLRATFKVVGEKARVLEQRGRRDVIDALRRHEIGYHSNFHSVQPSPAMYLDDMDWDEGVAEFDRRERVGLEDVTRIFGVKPSCYGQPGSSWAPQAYGALRRWGVPVYLDGGRHVNLQEKPCYFCGVLNLYRLAHMMRADLADPATNAAEERFLAARRDLLAGGGGLVSIMYHPCEFVHKQFWDRVNFQNGANPPRERWQLPPLKSPEQSRLAFDVFERYIRFIARLPEVRFTTASEAARLYRDRARGRAFSDAEVLALAEGVGDEVTYQAVGDCYLSAAEVFAVLNDWVVARLGGRNAAAVELADSPIGPTRDPPHKAETVQTDDSQFGRTARDVASFLRAHGRVPSSVWLGSVAVAPEAFVRALGRVVREVHAGKPVPHVIEIPPARLGARRYVAEDDGGLWRWVIFPRGFRAPGVMAMARRQAWTLKPAVLNAAALDAP